MGIDAMPPSVGRLPARVLLGAALRAQSDRRLVRLVRDGYESAFDEIVRRYRPPLDRFAASIVGDRSEDVTQDSLRKALEALRRGNDDVDLRPWLFRIVRNTALNDLRDRPAAAAELTEELTAGGHSAAAEAERRADFEMLVAQLLALPEKQRAALMMRELEGMSHVEIAAALGISDGAARQAIARARAAVRSGFGVLIPLPLLRVLAFAGDRVAGSATGAGAAVGGGAAIAGAGGIGAGALKIAAVTVVVAGTVGAGVAIERHGAEGHPAVGPQAAIAAPASEPGAGAPAPSDRVAEVEHRPAVDAGREPGDPHRRPGRHRLNRRTTNPPAFVTAQPVPATGATSGPEAGLGPGPDGKTSGGSSTGGRGGAQGSGHEGGSGFSSGAGSSTGSGVRPASDGGGDGGFRSPESGGTGDGPHSPDSSGGGSGSDDPPETSGEAGAGEPTSSDGSGPSSGSGGDSPSSDDSSSSSGEDSGSSPTAEPSSAETSLPSPEPSAGASTSSRGTPESPEASP